MTRGIGPARHARRRRARSIRDDRGSAIVEAALIYPLVILCLFTLLQVAFYMHGIDSARHAADQAVRAAQAESATSQSGLTAAQQVLDQVPGLNDPSVSVSRTPTEVQVTVSGTITSLVPGWSPVVSATAAGPVERWTQP